MVKESCAVNVPVAASTARTVTMYLSGVVPVAASPLVAGGALPFVAAPPHATIPPRAKPHRTIESIVRARRRPGNPKQRRHASIAPPRTADQTWLADASAAAVVPAAVVVTVRVDCTDCEFVIVTAAGLKLHFGILTSPLLVPVTEHVRFTAPVNPPCALTSTAVVDVLPGWALGCRRRPRTERQFQRLASTVPATCCAGDNHRSRCRRSHEIRIAVIGGHDAVVAQGQLGNWNIDDSGAEISSCRRISCSRQRAARPQNRAAGLVRKRDCSVWKLRGASRAWPDTPQSR